MDGLPEQVRLTFRDNGDALACVAVAGGRKNDQKQQKTQLFFVKLHFELHFVIQNYQNSFTNQVKLILLMTHLERLHDIKRKFRIKNI